MSEITLRKLKDEIEKYPANHGNVLRDCAPVYANWTVNPGTHEEITHETSAAILSVPGDGAVGNNTITYDLKTLKRRIVYLNCEKASRLYIAGEDQVYHDTIDLDDTNLIYTTSAVGLFRYVRFVLAGDVTISYLKIRVYDLEADY